MSSDEEGKGFSSVDGPGPVGDPLPGKRAPMERTSFMAGSETASAIAELSLQQW